MIMNIITDAKAVLARASGGIHDRGRQQKHVVRFDAYYVLLLEDGYLPGEIARFPDRVLTRELLADMRKRVVDLPFTSLRSLGVYFGQDRFEGLGLTGWRHMTGN